MRVNSLPRQIYGRLRVDTDDFRASKAAMPQKNSILSPYIPCSQAKRSPKPGGWVLKSTIFSLGGSSQKLDSASNAVKK